MILFNTNRVLSIVALSTFLLFGCGKADREKIVGTWEETAVLDGNMAVKMKTTYHPAGTWDSEGIILGIGGKADLVVSGTWELKEGWLHSTIKSSNRPDIFPNDFTSADQVVEISKFTMVVKNKDGKLQVSTRAQ